MLGFISLINYNIDLCAVFHFASSGKPSTVGSLRFQMVKKKSYKAINQLSLPQGAVANIIVRAKLNINVMQAVRESIFMEIGLHLKNAIESAAKDRILSISAGILLWKA